MVAASREIINKMDSILFPLIIGFVVVWLAFKEGLTRGAEKTMTILENDGIIEIDSQGNIRSTKWEYVYKDHPDDA